MATKLILPAPPSRTSWTSVAAGASAARAAFATLDGAAQQLLEAALFDGQSCTALARAGGVAATEIRSHLAAAMHALHAMLVGEPGEAGAVAAMLALHALDALDSDETALVD